MMSSNLFFAAILVAGILIAFGPYGYEAVAQFMRNNSLSCTVWRSQDLLYDLEKPDFQEQIEHENERKERRCDNVSFLAHILRRRWLMW